MFQDKELIERKQRKIYCVVKERVRFHFPLSPAAKSALPFLHRRRVVVVFVSGCSINLAIKNWNEITYFRLEAIATTESEITKLQSFLFFCAKTKWPKKIKAKLDSIDKFRYNEGENKAVNGWERRLTDCQRQIDSIL